MVKVDTTSRLSQLRGLMKNHNVHVYGMTNSLWALSLNGPKLNTKRF